MTDAARKDRPDTPKYTMAQLEAMEMYELRLAFTDVFGWEHREEALNLGTEELINAILGDHPTHWKGKR